MPLILASASPRRRELLSILLEDFVVLPADVDESVRPGEPPADYVVRIARAKAEGVAAQHPGALVLGADTAVVVENSILGKPADHSEARRMLRALSGRGHEVFSAVVLARAGTASAARVSRSTVLFDQLPAKWIEAYLASGEPMDKAGAYAIQGRAGAWIRHLEGSYTGVVGLPLYECASLLRQAGLPL